jgi:hypothetical protein
MRYFLPLIVCSTFSSATPLHAVDATLSFLDLRAQAGVAQTEEEMASVTLMGGVIGNREYPDFDMGEYVGIVIGGRGSLMKTTVEREDNKTDGRVKCGGGAVLGGFGFYTSEQSHLELLFSYGQGVGTTTGDTPWDDDDVRYKLYAGEIGWYYTTRMGVQIGVVGGYSLIKATYNDSVNEIRAKNDGVDGSVALGYRF